MKDKFSNLDLDKVVPNTSIKNQDIYIVGTDKVNGYDIAIKPKKRKTRGCVFCIPKSINAPIIAWHYLWDYLATYPTRFYNVVPITRKYAFTFIDLHPLLTIEDVKKSRSCKTFGFIQKNKVAMDYITEWQNKVGDLRGLFFFFFALTHSKVATDIAKNVLHKNSPIWCPELSDTNLDDIRKIIQVSTAYAIFKFGKKFQEFTLLRNKKVVIETENYFDLNSNWFKKSKISKFLLNIKKENTAMVKSIIAGELSEKEIKGFLDDAIKRVDSY